MSRTAEVTLAWFGKLPSRGDFVRSTQQGMLTQMLDQWLAQGLALLSADSRWKQIYDGAAACPFALLGVRSRVALAGFMRPSSDASGRRFPFVLTGSLELDAPAGFLPLAPLALAPLWGQLEAGCRQAGTADDPSQVLGELGWPKWEVEVERAPLAATLKDFLDSQTLASVEGLLRGGGHEAVDLRRILVALGLLLQPVPASGVSSLDKGLSLPLPADALYSAQVAAFWLALVTPFISRGDFELSLHLARNADGHPVLAIGFAGASPNTLHAMLDADQAGETFVELLGPTWVDEHLEQDYAMKKLSSYLLQPQLSLSQAFSTFKECFLGE
ncbi:type VI secretion system-associated protein TagF [Ideonella azotifigens]|uniref:Type VI secretion system-associated protein TagF n=1 Tax=Ideonella azotifigens TaxID=513160 RepID=A0ABP3VCF1_9BURK|nr:type VI secretion system-associated protein TagF [Ideonella azotifigens]MCD2341541.1 type VI secretion system-associated protein TagF [Ideonella azotifigens]